MRGKGNCAMRRLILRSAALSPACLWLYVFVDCQSFHAWATEYLADTASIDAANDLRYARMLLLCAGLGLAASLASALWLAHRRTIGGILVLVGLAAFGLAFLLGDHAHPIHLFPTGMSLMTAFGAFSFGLAALLSPVGRGSLRNACGPLSGARR